MEEAFQILVKEDVRREKQRKMKQQLAIQWQKSPILSKITKKGYWSDDEIESNGNDVHVQLNNTVKPYELQCHSSIRFIRGKAPMFDTITLLKGEKYLEEIIIYKVIDESHIGNVEFTCLDPCSNDPILCTVGTSGTWTNSMDDVLPIQMVYANESGNLMLQHPSLFQIK